MTDRSQWPARKIRLQDDDDRSDVAHLTPSERVAMVWEITKTAWAFKDPSFRESRLRRDIGRVIRGRGQAAGRPNDLVDVDELAKS